jgi:hypothetical protein
MANAVRAGAGVRLHQQDLLARHPIPPTLPHFDSSPVQHSDRNASVIVVRRYRSHVLQWPRNKPRGLTSANRLLSQALLAPRNTGAAGFLARLPLGRLRTPSFRERDDRTGPVRYLHGHYTGTSRRTGKQGDPIHKTESNPQRPTRLTKDPTRKDCRSVTRICRSITAEPLWLARPPDGGIPFLSRRLRHRSSSWKPVSPRLAAFCGLRPECRIYSGGARSPGRDF